MNTGSTFYADKAQLDGWLTRAKPGDSAIYATGPALDPKNETVALVRDWKDTGEVTCVQRRVEGRLTYQVQRIARRAVEEPKKRLQLDGEFEESAAGKLLRHLARLANAGLPCPSNAVLADAVGLRNEEGARYQLKLLAAAGHVRINKLPAGRVVLIVETGARTVEPVLITSSYASAAR